MIELILFTIIILLLIINFCPLKFIYLKKYDKKYKFFIIIILLIFISLLVLLFL